MANKLHASGLISSVSAFIARLTELGLTGELLDGTYELPMGLETDDLISRLVLSR
ncbi:MAG: hypothetical protein LBJ10_09275 [Clostridiales bacterium]|nr:hypothetical protein [Clostridiales bacterium]